MSSVALVKQGKVTLCIAPLPMTTVVSGCALLTLHNSQGKRPTGQETLHLMRTDKSLLGTINHRRCCSAVLPLFKLLLLLLLPACPQPARLLSLLALTPAAASQVTLAAEAAGGAAAVTK